MPRIFFVSLFSPLNMLDSYENRFGYSFAFGLTAYSCIMVVIGSYGSILGPETAESVRKWPAHLSGVRVFSDIT